ncbi:putative lipid II flippase FtsW [Pyruvatibacter sp.]|uniref:putative lipid II flippase FtsW n=1 Tax=unclassified Pyruvatibacter TaxID=2618840 RepID=UPI0029690F83|nr:putative lipid II flippase FtsW [Alphaproteobacteria bacterium]
MIRLARTDKSAIAQWWWTVDRWTFAALILLLGLGTVMSLAASPAVATRIGLEPYHFFYRHLIYLVPALLIMFGVSLLSPRGVRRLATLIFAGALVLMVATLLIGPEIKGATRWLYVGPFSLQPSEFAKAGFVVVCAWMFAEGSNRESGIPGNTIAAALWVATIGILVLQPDFGQALLVTGTWGALFFLAGIPWIWIVLLASLAMAGAYGAYIMMPHVASRIDRFLDPASGDTYQIDTALDAFSRGGFLGMGPGEGTIKRVLPDAHTDYIYAVTAEEFGALMCLLVLAIFGFVVLRSFARVMGETDKFVQLSACGLAVLFGVQSIINLGVNLNLLPAKGMTLPFVSYGGSSLIALAISMGMLLSLTRRRVGSQAALTSRIIPGLRPARLAGGVA